MLYLSKFLNISNFPSFTNYATQFLLNFLHTHSAKPESVPCIL